MRARAARARLVGVRHARDSHGAAPVARSSRVLAAAGLLVLLAACSGGSGGDGGDGGSSASPTTSPSAATSEPAPSGSAVALTAGSSVVGLPEGVAAPPAGAVAGASRTTDPSLIYVITFGSSTCPMVADPDAVATGATDADEVEITFPEPTGGACTADYVPATTVVALPEEPAGDLRVLLGPAGDVTLPAGSVAVEWVIDQG